MWWPIAGLACDIVGVVLLFFWGYSLVLRVAQHKSLEDWERMQKADPRQTHVTVIGSLDDAEFLAKAGLAFLVMGFSLQIVGAVTRA